MRFVYEKSKFVKKLEEKIKTEKFETVLEYAYNADERDISLVDTLEFILERKTPYYKRKMIKNCLSKPYSDWFDALYSLEFKNEYDKWDRAIKPNLTEEEREWIAGNRIGSAIFAKYSMPEILEFFSELFMDWLKNSSSYDYADTIGVYASKLFDDDIVISIAKAFLDKLLKKDPYDAFDFVKLNDWGWFEEDDAEEILRDYWKSFIPYYDSLEKSEQKIIINQLVKKPIDIILTMFNESGLNINYFWSFVGEYLLKTKGDLCEINRTIEFLRLKGYTLAEINENVLEYISKRMTGKSFFAAELTIGIFEKNMQDLILQERHDKIFK